MDKNLKIAVVLSAYDKMSTIVNMAVTKSQKSLASLKKSQENLNKFGDKATVAGLGGVAAITAAVKAYANIEKMQVALTTAMGGNKKAADAAFKSIQNFAARTPYEMGEVMTAFVKLKNMGLDPSEKALQAYGNTASAMGKNLDQMIEAVADAATGEFERLKEFGIKAKQQGEFVSFTFQNHTTKVAKDAKKIEAYLQLIGQKKFAGGIEAQSKTLDGQLSTLKDNFTMAAGAIGKVFVPGINKAFARLGPLIDKVQQFISTHPNFTSFVGAASIGLVGVGIAAKGMAFSMGLVSPVMKAASFAMKLLQGDAAITAIAMNGLKAAMMSTGIMIVIAAIAAGAYLIYKNWGKISAWFGELWNKVKSIFSKTWQSIKNFFLNYTPAGLIFRHWGIVTYWFDKIWTKVKEIFSTVWEGIKNFLLDYTPAGIIYRHWDEIISYFTNIWEKVKNVFKNAWASIKNGLKSFFGPGSEIDTALSKYEAGLKVNVTGSGSPAGVPSSIAALRPVPISHSNSSSVNYNPTFHFNGVGSPGDANAITGQIKNDFDKQMQQYLERQKRIGFSN